MFALNTGRFPSYQENVYYYAYDNVGFIVLNPEYWVSKDPKATSGNTEGYVMDNQRKWFKETMARLEKDPAIDHIFVLSHDAVFPNGDHLMDAMWYFGNNDARAFVAGKPVSKCIIERRDEIIDMCANKSQKFLGFFSGDEHNFSFLQVTPNMPHYENGSNSSILDFPNEITLISSGFKSSSAVGAGSLSFSSSSQTFR